MQALAPDLSQDDKSVIFNMLDLPLNRMIMQASLHGLYTGIVAVSLWTTFSSPKGLHNTFLHTIIIMLYFLSTISFVMTWIYGYRAFIECGNNYYSMFAALMYFPCWRVYYLADGSTGGISTLLVGATIIWRCWVLQDRQWRIVSLPIVCAIAGTFMKVMQILSAFHNVMHDISNTKVFAVQIDWSLIYILLTLSATVLCTVLIVYRIVHFTHRLLLFRGIISALIESSAIYTLALIVYLALVAKNMTAADYADTFAAYVKAIATTLLMLHVAVKSNSSCSNEEHTSRHLSEICFQRMEEGSSDDVGDPSGLGSHCGVGTTEVV
ncbi:hypothetical protein ARMGADRAFT_1077630 [Armillaria gallica]|uniref:Uncharacterized protein n=1 Tax=Armillaria gallica TaxID=47427 RepID=A0A2H3DLN6_ARMGA|nr:hypothetical protein ARMGADRAFT_1077630 [Armillaria gallica]